MHRVIALTRAGGKLISRADGKLVVQHEKVAFAVDTQTGVVVPTEPVRPEPPRAGDPEVALGRAGLRLSERETERGPSTRILTKEGVDLAVFAGVTQRFGVAGHVFGGIVERADHAREIVAGVLGDRDRQVLRMADEGRTAAAGKDFVAVAGAGSAIHFFRTLGGALARVSVGAPASPASSILVEGDMVWLVVESQLLGIDVTKLPRETRGAHAITFMPVVPPPAPATDPARVAFVIATSIGIDHPRLGRIVIPRSAEHPQVEKGDVVVLEDVYEELPGIFRARAFRTASGQASARPPPPPLECAAPSVDELLVSWDELGWSRGPSSGMREGLRGKLEALATRHRFVVPTLLARLLDEADADAVVNRWLDRLGFQAEVRFKCTDWGADPFCLGFASEGNGDAYCLYPYPPVSSGEPPIVEFFHETNEAELVAMSFDAFFGDFLAQRVEWKEPGHAEIVELLVARFGLAQPARIVKPPKPDWLPECLDDDDLVSKADVVLQENEPVLAERFLVSRWLAQDKPDARVKARLEELYEKLGWTLALESLRSAT